MENQDIYIGKIFNGKYLIKEQIGVGGMALVYRAENTATGASFAIKILNEESRKDEKAVERFVNESKAVSMLSHENIVAIHDVGCENGTHFIVMEYVDGITLSEYIEFKKKLEWKEAVFYVSQILKALGHAHAMGIIHRDVKPQNIMLTRDGVIKVMDFGIAKMINSKAITVTDKAIGTVNYMSPEQASGKAVGFYSDIYSVGIMLYEMTTGTLPFVSESSMAVAMMQVSDIPTPPSEKTPDIPHGLEQIIMKALEKEPEDRFSSCAAMEKALSILSSDPSVVFTEHTKMKKKKTQTGTKRSFLPIILGVTLSFFIVAAVSAAGLAVKFYESKIADDGEDIRIPELVGQQYTDELKSMLSDNNFSVIEKWESKGDMPIGQIVEQTPDGGSTRRLSNPNASCEITLVINAGAQKVILGDYSNTESRSAKLQLTKLGISSVVVEQNDSTVIEGYIIKTDPAPGTIIEKGSQVTLYVSKGALLEMTSVPKIIGLSQDAAKRALGQSKISIGDISYIKSEQPAGVVISASHDEGERVPAKITKVSITVSIGGITSASPDDTTEQNDETTTDVTEDEASGQDSLSYELGENPDAEPEPATQA